MAASKVIGLRGSRITCKQLNRWTGRIHQLVNGGGKLAAALRGGDIAHEHLCYVTNWRPHTCPGGSLVESS
jgi:hypothetical protein